MPIKLQPVVRPTYSGRAAGSVFTSEVQRWGARQEYDPDAAWTQIGNNRRGTIGGGPTFTRLLQFGDEQSWAVVAPRPAITEPVFSEEREYMRRQLGALDLDLADPFHTFEQMADQGKLFAGEENNPLAWLNEPMGFLRSKDVDPFGMGNTGAPARAADYALAFPIAVFNKLTGQSLAQKDPGAIADVDYRFQADPRYWYLVTNSSPRELDQLARTLVGQLADPDRNSYLVDQIRRQFDVDRQVAIAKTSGNEAIDYTAIKSAYAAAVGAPFYRGQGWQPIPVIGTQVAKSFDPIHPYEQEYWDSLPAEVRRAALTDAGLRQMSFDFIGSLPALTGFSTVLFVAKAGGVGGQAGKTLYETYNWTMRGAGVVMTTGLVAATTNWALEATVPGYEDFLGRSVDLSRPISGSQLAGVINATGYWASGTWGIWGAAKLGGKVIRGTVKPVATKLTPSNPVGGSGIETPLYAQGHGGARMAGRLVNEGLDPGQLSLSQKHLEMSYVSHLMRDHDEDMWRAIIDGEDTGNPNIDQLPPELRVEAANEYLARAEAANPALVEMAFRIKNLARQSEDLFPEADDVKKLQWAREQAKTIDDLVAARYIRDYGPAFMLRTTGGNDVASLKRYVVSAFERMGIDPTRILTSRRSREDWEKTVRAVYHYEFDRANGLMQAAVDAAPTKEAGRISLMSARHLFADEVDDVVAVLRGSDEAAARALVERLINSKIEIETWYSRRWQPPRESSRSPALVDPKVLANYIEDIAAALPMRRGKPGADPDTADLELNKFQNDLDEDGLWSIAFKPVDEDGNFVSYVRTRDGTPFRSSWLDYPLSSTDMIELGNAGLVRAKLDGIFRGFRTWRLSEFQRGSLFRSLSADYPFTATQIDEFHERLLTMARRLSVQPQTMGTVAGPINTAGVGTAWRDMVERLAQDVFGSGPYVTRGGKLQDIDWTDVIAKAYRQSLKLNLTAGLTSHLKSRLGEPGHAAAWMSDIAYVNVRFNYSPLFKWSEFTESLGFNTMRGVNPAGDPWNEALFYRAGVGNDYGVLGQELAYDQMIAGMNKRGSIELTPEQRQAQTYMWYARHMPEDFAGQAERISKQEAMAEHLADVESTIGRTTPRANPARPLEALKNLPPDEPGFLYHVTDDLPGVRDSGLEPHTPDHRGEQDAWPDGSDEARSYWTTTARGVDPFVSIDSFASGAIVRTRQTPRFRQERGTSDVITDETIPPDQLDYIGEDGQWWPLVADDVPFQTEEAGVLQVGLARDAPREAGYLYHSTPMESWTRILADGELRPGDKGRLYFGTERYGVMSPKGVMVRIPVDEFLEAGKFRTQRYTDFPVRLADVEIWGADGAWHSAFEMPGGSAPDLGPIYTGDKDTLLAQLRTTIPDTPTSQRLENELAGIVDDAGDFLPGFERRGMEILEELRLLDEETGTPQADRIEDVFGTPEHLEQVVNNATEEALPGWRERLRQEGLKGPINAALDLALPNPLPFKQRQASLQQIQYVRRQFPSLLRAAGMDGPIEVFQRLGIREDEWAAFLIRDRELLLEAQTTNDPAAWAALMDHAPGERQVLDELYQSEAWSVITSLWAINARSAADDAFKTHFFNPYRSAFERSINHPLLAVYPASWAYKAAKEWVRFLYNNEMFGGLRIGMVPAVAINNIVDAQNQAFAQTNPDELEQYIGRRGPFGSTFFIFNLLMPGDWSSIPFPLSRTIRDTLRGNTDLSYIVQQNFGGLGIARDVRLAGEMLGEVDDYIWGPSVNDPEKPWSPRSDNELWKLVEKK